jgi:DnaK suppressor protein
MIGEPVASAKDLQRYKGLLLEKQRELSSVQGDAGARVPAAGGLEGDLIDQANADAKAELQIRLHQTDSRLFRAIEGALGRIRQGAFGVCQVCKRSISKARLEAVPLKHGLHLVGAIAALLYLMARLVRSHGAVRRSLFDGTAIYRHFMGVLWLYLLLVPDAIRPA